MKLFKKSAILLFAILAVAIGAISVYAVISNSASVNAPASDASQAPAAVSEPSTETADNTRPITYSINTKDLAPAVQSEDADELTVTVNGAKKSVTLSISIPTAQSNDVSVLCMNPLYSKDSIDQWTTEQDKVCYIDQVTLNAQGKANLTFNLDELIRGEYTLSVGTAAQSYLETFRMLEPNGWSDNGYYKDDVLQTSTWVDGKYYLDASGKKVTNAVVTIQNQKYAFDQNGVRVTGTKWVKVSGKEVYVENGLVKANAWVGDARTDANGIKIENAKIKVGGSYYIIKGGKLQKGNKLVTLDKKTYYVNKSGAVALKKVVTVKGKKYAFDQNGVRVTGTKWVKLGAKQVYVSKGFVKANAWVGKYRTDKNGARIVNAKIKVGGKYYIIKNSKKQTGNKLVTFKKKQYFVNKAGVVAVKKTVTYKGKKYVANKLGVCKRK